LGGRLAFYILLVLGGGMALFLGLYLAVFNPKLNAEVTDMVTRGALSNAKVIANKYNYEIQFASTKEEFAELSKHLLEDLNKEHTAVAVVLFDPEKKKTTEASKSYEIDLEKLYAPIVKKGEEVAVLKDDHVVAFTSINNEENLPVSLLVLIESIKEYNDTQFDITLWMVLAFIAIFFFILVSVGIVGKRAALPIRNIASHAERIAGGDLTELGQTEQSVAETAALSKSVSEMARALRKQVLAIKELTANSSKVSRDVARAMANLAASATEQVAAVAETAATVEEMERTGKSVAKNAKQIVEAAEKSTEASVRGQGAVDTTSDIILKIKDDSKDISTKSKILLSNVEEIGNIINSVSAISGQSKILAVNASIQAAKAGKFGSGFAVVAREVKDLAGQSKEATEQITETLTSIRHAIQEMVGTAEMAEERTEQGVTSVSNAGAIVNDLSEAIREASDLANVINTSVVQQTIGLSQIASAIEQINISATENQDISRNIEKGTDELSVSLDQLGDIVGEWTTDQGQKKKP
jgi:methyl-accepting chemotaxis protein